MYLEIFVLGLGSYFKGDYIRKSGFNLGKDFCFLKVVDSYYSKCLVWKVYFVFKGRDFFFIYIIISMWKFFLFY